MGAKQRELLTRDTCKQAPGKGAGSGGLDDPIGSQRSSRNSSEAERGVVCFCRGKASKVFPGPWKVFPIPGKQGDCGSVQSHGGEEAAVKGSGVKNLK